MKEWEDNICPQHPPPFSELCPQPVVLTCNRPTIFRSKNTVQPSLSQKCSQLALVTRLPVKQQQQHTHTCAITLSVKQQQQHTANDASGAMRHPGSKVTASGMKVRPGLWQMIAWNSAEDKAALTGTITFHSASSTQLPARSPA